MKRGQCRSGSLPHFIPPHAFLIFSAFCIVVLPSCTALLDSWEGAVPHVEGLGANIAAVAKAPIGRVAAFAAHRGWRNLKLLSAANNTFKPREVEGACVSEVQSRLRGS